MTRSEIKGKLNEVSNKIFEEIEQHLLYDSAIRRQLYNIRCEITLACNLLSEGNLEK